jgi:hypothetical protein
MGKPSDLAQGTVRANGKALIQGDLPQPIGRRHLSMWGLSD